MCGIRHHPKVRWAANGKSLGNANVKRETAIPTFALLFAAIAAVPELMWIHVFEKKGLSQPERVIEFMNYFPPLLRSLSTINSVAILCAAAGLSVGIAATLQRGWSRVLGLIASMVCTILLALYLFQLL